ncbi:hypothetical protein TIFTF001_035218 [Ficus carica]|uniref:NADP-dependent oxidoreductase domain-containing protein n=1 Tax=Ficus carica TaxID=3494 RepID=A0AA88J9X5_FICCA|nr:hypothetical protein TIFTF001_035218 [Ficus carica]
MATVRRIKLGLQGLEVSAQGLGCMGMSAFYGPLKPEPNMIALIHHAVNSGVTFLDTADMYGPFTNEILLGKALNGGVREREFSWLREGSLRGQPQAEASASTIRRAHAVHPITAVQLEWSLWARDAEEDIIPTGRESGIGIVAYSPLGRGFMSSGPKIVENLSDDDYRKLALAWAHHQGKDVCPIPGTTKIENFDQNVGALSVKLTPEEMAELESLASAGAVKGDRYDGNVSNWKDSETPPLYSWKPE